jgi:hypothetical protein
MLTTTCCHTTCSYFCLRQNLFPGVQVPVQNAVTKKVPRISSKKKFSRFLDTKLTCWPSKNTCVAMILLHTFLCMSEVNYPQLSDVFLTVSLYFQGNKSWLQDGDVCKFHFVWLFTHTCWLHWNTNSAASTQSRNFTHLTKIYLLTYSLHTAQSLLRS